MTKNRCSGKWAQICNRSIPGVVEWPDHLDLRGTNLRCHRLWVSECCCRLCEALRRTRSLSPTDLAVVSRFFRPLDERRFTWLKPCESRSTDKISPAMASQR